MVEAGGIEPPIGRICQNSHNGHLAETERQHSTQPRTESKVSVSINTSIEPSYGHSESPLGKIFSTIQAQWNYDPESFKGLCDLVVNWPKLPDHIRRAIIILLKP